MQPQENTRSNSIQSVFRFPTKKKSQAQKQQVANNKTAQQKKKSANAHIKSDCFEPRYNAMWLMPAKESDKSSHGFVKTWTERVCIEA